MSDTRTDDLAAEIGKIQWYHRMDLCGIVTPGVSNTQRGLSRLHLPSTFSGKSVLDIGSWDGFYAFEAARRGAKRVVATDSFVWEGKTWGSKEGFLLARKALDLDARVEDRLIDVMDLSPESLGATFDVTLFLGVLYHLKNPIEALDRVSSVTNELLILETETALNWFPASSSRVYVDELAHDESNLFAFNKRALVALLERRGFSRVDIKFRTSAVRRCGHGLRAVRRSRLSEFLPAYRSSRIVVHAFR